VGQFCKKTLRVVAPSQLKNHLKKPVIWQVFLCGNK